MKRIFLTIIYSLLAGLTVAGESRFDQANRQFESGDIAGAAVVYQEILASDGPSASVLFNLGNCEQRLGKYGYAILAYERARLLAPRDPDLLANLDLARKAATAFGESERHPVVDAFLNYLSLNEWSWLMAGSVLVLGGLTLLCGCVRMRRRWVIVGMRISAGFAVLLIVGGAIALVLRRDEANRGIVLNESAVVRLSPFEKAESLGAPGQGQIVRIFETKDGFHFIEVSGTKLRGWISDKEVSAICRTRCSRLKS
jgi:tetratricopeptide (TPR) repeat protein